MTDVCMNPECGDAVCAKCGECRWCVGCKCNKSAGSRPIAVVAPSVVAPVDRGKSMTGGTRPAKKGGK